MNRDLGPGSYALCLWVDQEVRIQVGKLGVFDFRPGGYVYLGSAHGPGGVPARLKHHYCLAIKPQWHLDWLRPHARIVAVYAALGLDRLECSWSKALAELPGSTILAAGFGASDCRNACSAHLIYFANGISLEPVRSVLQAAARQDVRDICSAALAELD